MRDWYWLLRLVPIYAIGARAGAAGWFVLVVWIANALMFALGGLVVGVIGMIGSIAIAFHFRDRLDLRRFWKRTEQ
jgi:hypothetical protein